MAEKKQERKTTVVIDEELHRKIRVKSAPDDLPFQQVVVDLLRQWVDPASKVPLSAIPAGTAEENLEVVKRFLRLWHAPEGPEIYLRDLIGKTLDVEPPKNG